MNVRVFPDETPQCGWVRGPEENKRLRKKEFSLPVFGLGRWSPAFRLGLGLELTSMALRVLRPLDLSALPISSPGASSLLTHPAALGLLSLRNSVS